ncbi:MAG: PH domain-containing protein [Balneolaceae bacterium]
MSDYNRQHPVAAITRAVDLVRDNLITIIVLMVVGASGSGEGMFLWWFVGFFLFLLVAGTVGWWRFVYRMDEGELQIKQGVFVRKSLYLTRDRVQVIDVTAGIIQRMFGLVSVEIKTAGSTSREASLSAVTESEAERITTLLRNGEKRGGADLSDDFQVSAGEGHGQEPTPSERTYRLPGKELVIAASTSGSFGIALSIIATVFSQVEPLISESRIYEWLIAYLPSETDGFFILTILTVFVVFAWLMSFFGTLFKYGDFSLTLNQNEMIVRRGIFEKKSITVPFNRIQALRIVEGVMRQPFGYASLHVESAGYGDQREGGSVVIYPLIKREEIELFLEENLPDYPGELSAYKPAARSVTRYIVRSTLVLALIIAGVYWVLDASHWIWLCVLPGVIWGWLRHKDAAIGADPERLIVRSRILARTTAVIRKNRAQDVSLRASWIQQFRNFANLEVSVASGDQGRSFTIRELEVSTAEELLPWIARENGYDFISNGPVGNLLS